jgi:hypothetical protein
VIVIPNNAFSVFIGFCVVCSECGEQHSKALIEFDYMGCISTLIPACKSCLNKHEKQMSKKYRALQKKYNALKKGGV